MDNNKSNSGGNQSADEQPKPIFETVPGDTKPNAPQSPPMDNLQPEEISPDVSTTEEAFVNPPPEFPSDQPPPSFEDHRMKFVIIGGAVLFFIIILVVILRLIFGGNKPAATKAVTLNYWGLWEEKEVFDQLINEYKKSNPNVTINYQKMSPVEYREKLIARSKNGKGPDIFRFHNTWLPEIQEVAAPLPTSIMNNEEFEKTFFPVHSKDLKVDKYYYGIPLELDGLVLLYNDNLFKKAGITRAPSNWDQVIDYVEQLTVKDSTGALITSGIALGTASNVEHYSDIFGLMLVQNGGDLKNLKAAEAIQALEVYRKFAEPPTDFWNDTMPNSITAFIQEKVAMIIAPSWEIAVIKSANPDIVIKVAPVPNVPGAKPISLANYWVEGVSKFSANQIEAWKFLKFLSTQESMQKLFEAQSKTRLFGEPYSRVDLADKLIKHEYLGPVVQQADRYYSLPLISRTYDNGLNDQITDYIKDAINATAKGVSYQEALNTASKGIQQVFDRYKIK